MNQLLLLLQTQSINPLRVLFHRRPEGLARRDRFDVHVVVSVYERAGDRWGEL